MQPNRVMGQDSVERYIGRILTDDVFRREAHLSFDTVCAGEGFAFTDGERRTLRGLDHDLFERLSARIDTGIKRSAGFMDFGGGMPLLGASGHLSGSGNSNKSEG